MTSYETAPVDPEIQRLVDGHPLLFRGRAPVVPSDLPHGWRAITDRLCSSIERELGPQGCAAIEVRQIKEKFAGLRFYVRERSARGVQRPSEVAMSRVRELIADTSEMSEQTCQVCGAPGAVYDVHGYMVTRCQHHLQAAHGRQP